MNKTNPSLLPWKQLAKEIKGFNRNLIRGIPEILALTGYAIVKANGHKDKMI